MLNNKGQSLSMFVLFLPILLLIVIIIFDLGKMYNIKLHLDNINKLAINYGLNNIDKENKEELLNEFLDNNLEKTNKSITYLDKSLEIELTYNCDGLFIHKIIKIKSNYYGYLDNDKIKIKKNKGDKYE